MIKRPLINRFACSFLIAAVLLVSCEKPVEITRSPINGPLPDGAYKAGIRIVSAMEVLPIDTLTEVKLKVKNKSNYVWPAGSGKIDEPYSIYVSYRWLSKSGKVISEGGKTPIPHDVRPGEEAIIYVKVNSVLEGDYFLEFDLYQDGVGPFKSKGSKAARMKVRILTKI